MALALCALTPGPGLAQNAAEADPPAAAEAGEHVSTPAETETEAEPPPTIVDAAAQPPAETAGEAQGNVAETSPTAGESAEPAGETPGAAATEAATEETPQDNVAEAGVPAGTGEAGERPLFTPTTPGEAGPPPQPPGEIVEVPNAAEAPPAATEAGNLAESAADDELAEPRIAEPPEPEIQLPHPSEIAGPVAGYTEPSLEIFVPQLQPRPDRPSPDAFFQPARSYLEDRPLPALDVDETDEERIARSIEESLSLLNLALEQRPDEGIQIPLPSGLMTFKASDSFQYDRRNKILTFTGDVELVFNDIAIWADMIEVDDGAATAYAKGYVAVQQADDIVYCDEAYINYDTETLELFWVEGNISGSMKSPTSGLRLYEPMYYEADRVYGSFDYMILYKARITTCPPLCGAHPDYVLKSDKVHYKRGKSVVLHDAYLFLRDTKVAWVPLLAIPLPKEQRFAEEESDIEQEYGYSGDEGYFAHFGYTYSTRWVDEVSKPLLGAMIMRIMTKKGAGVGIKQDYYIPSLGVGTVKAYYKDDWPDEVARDLIDRADGGDSGSEFNYQFGQDLNFSRALSGTLELSRINNLETSGQQSGGYRRNTWDAKFNLNFSRNQTTAGLTLRQNDNRSGATGEAGLGSIIPKSKRDVNLTMTRKLSKEFQFSGTQNYTEWQKGETARNPTDKFGDVTAQLRYRGAPDTPMQGYTSSLTYRKTNIDYDGADYTERETNYNDYEPTFHLEFPGDLLGEGGFFNSFNLDIERRITGKRGKPIETIKYLGSMRGGDKTDFSRSADLSYQLSLKQAYYDTGDALFAISPGATFNYDSRGWWDFKARWSMNYRQGVKVSPTEERETYSNSLNYYLNFYNRRSWRWALSSGYNFKDRHPGAIRSTFNWDPHKLFGLTHQVNYTFYAGRGDIPAHWEWGTSTMQATWHSPYITPDGYYNWILATDLRYQTDYATRFRMDQLRSTYTHRFDHGWSGEVTGYYSFNSDVDTDFNRIASLDFVKDVIKKIKVRKANCCTTWEAAWRRDSITGTNSVSLYLYLNALPQYPARYVGTGIAAEDDHYLLFPYEYLRDDVLTDVFGLDASEYRGILY